MSNNLYKPPSADMNNAPEVVPEHNQPGLEAVHHSSEPKYAPDHPPSYLPGAVGTGQQKRGPFGLSAWALAALAALLTAIILGIALGAGLGTALGSCNSNLSKARSMIGSSGASSSCGNSSSSSNSTSNPTVTANNSLTNYAPAAPSTVTSLKFDCPNLDGKNYTSHFNQTYRIDCQREIGAGGVSTTAGKPVGDLMGLIAYSIQDCMEACGGLNLQSFVNIRGDYVCHGVTWLKTMQGSLGYIGSNCFLKNATLSANQGRGTFSADAISAVQI